MSTRRSPSLARPIAVLAVAFAALTVAPAAQAASSITGLQVTNGDLVVDKIATLSLSGFNDPAQNGRRIEVDVNSPSLPCAETKILNNQRQVDDSSASNPPDGDFAGVVVQWSPKTAGDFLLCAYLSTSPTGEDTFAKLSVPVAVRQPLTSLGFSIPGARYVPNATIPLTVTASSEVRRDFSVEVNPVGVPCAPNQAANTDTKTWLSDKPITGGPTTAVFNVSAPSANGNYHLCGYVGTSSSDASPTTIVDSTPFTVGPPPSCKVGKAPKTKKKKVSITCIGVTGNVTVTGKRGSKTYKATVGLSATGKGSVKGTKIGLKKNKQVTVKVIVDGKTVGSRVLRVKK